MLRLPLPFDPDDPNTEIVTTVAVTSPEQGEWANELERQRGNSAEGPDTANSMPDHTLLVISSIIKAIMMALIIIAIIITNMLPRRRGC